MAEPGSPVRSLPAPGEDPEVFAIWTRVQSALAQLPDVFRTSLRLTGANPEDLFTFNTALGTSIERAVVRCLNNELRPVWDPDGTLADLSFERQGQVFPDAPLRRRGEAGRLFGIELKGWFVLAKEREPSFRYNTDPSVCTPYDLLVVVPWILDEVVRGTPRVFTPYVEQARYAAEWNTWYWQHSRQTDRETGLREVRVAASPTVRAKVDRTNKHAADDDGRNMGRFARTGLMEGWKADVFASTLAGVPVGLLQRCFESDPKASGLRVRVSAWADLLRGVEADRLAEVQAFLEDVRNAPEWGY